MPNCVIVTMLVPLFKANHGLTGLLASMASEWRADQPFI